MRKAKSDELRRMEPEADRIFIKVYLVSGLRTLDFADGLFMV
jgi:hypothetical protein